MSLPHFFVCEYLVHFYGCPYNTLFKTHTCVAVALFSVVSQQTTQKSQNIFSVTLIYMQYTNFWPVSIVLGELIELSQLKANNTCFLPMTAT